MDSIKLNYVSDKFELNPDQKRAFNRLKKALNDCESLNVYFYNNYGSLGLLNGYNNPNYDDDPNNGILDNGQNSHNEVKCPISWADDQHYFHFK